MELVVSNLNGKPVDIDGYPKDNPYQCMDLMRVYCRDYLKYGAYVLPTAKYAYQVFKNFPDSGDQYFKKIYNDPKDVNQLPEPGDILFFGPFVIGVTGIGGHVCIDYKKNKPYIISVDQNWPTGKFCQVTTHSWRGLMGWLHPIK